VRSTWCPRASTTTSIRPVPSPAAAEHGGRLVVGHLRPQRLQRDRLQRHPGTFPIEAEIAGGELVVQVDDLQRMVPGGEVARADHGDGSPLSVAREQFRAVHEDPEGAVDMGVDRVEAVVRDPQESAEHQRIARVDLLAEADVESAGTSLAESAAVTDLVEMEPVVFLVGPLGWRVEVGDAPPGFLPEQRVPESLGGTRDGLWRRRPG